MFDYEEAHYLYVFDKLMEERSNWQVWREDKTKQKRIVTMLSAM